MAQFERILGKHIRLFNTLHVISIIYYGRFRPNLIFPYVNDHHTEIMNSLLPIPHDANRRFVILLALLIIILLALLKSPQVLGKLVQHVYARTDSKTMDNNEGETL